MGKPKFKSITPMSGVTRFNKKFLNTLIEKSNSGVELHKTEHHLALHPIHLHNIKESIKDCLNQKLAKYNKTMGGIILGYQNVKLLSDKGHIVNDSCYIHIDLLVEFFVFKPKVKKKLSGIINKKSKSHIGVLVYDIFNVSIPKPKDDEDWLGHSVNLGQEILFRISDINMLSSLPYIGGKLISVVSTANETSNPQSTSKDGELLFSEMSNVEESSPKKVKKQKQIDVEVSPVLKNKKRKHIDATEEISESNLPTKKKRKMLEETLLNEIKNDVKMDFKVSPKFDSNRANADNTEKKLDLPAKKKRKMLEETLLNVIKKEVKMDFKVSPIFDSNRANADNTEEKLDLPAKKKRKHLNRSRSDVTVANNGLKNNGQELNRVEVKQEITSDLDLDINVMQKTAEEVKFDSLSNLNLTFDETEVAVKKSRKSKSKKAKELENIRICQDTWLKKERVEEDEESFINSLNFDKQILENGVDADINNLKHKRVRDMSDSVGDCDISVKKHKKHKRKSMNT